MYRRLALLAGGFVLLSAGPLSAQDAVLRQMYGSGVHAFFAYDYQQAYADLTAAIDAGSTDPRCYYFRGLTYLQLGRDDEAAMDFEQGARLESQDTNKFYDVSRALERVQGQRRLLIEQYRVEARMEALKREEQRRRQRYGELRAAEQRVLETQAEAAPAAPVEAPEPPAKSDDPFAVGPAELPAEPGGEPSSQAAPAAEEPEQPEQAVMEQPDAEQPDEPTPAAPDDPFAVQPAEQPAMEQPTVEEPEEPAPAETPAAEAPSEPAAPAASGAAVFGALGRALGSAVTEGLGEESPTEPLPGFLMPEEPVEKAAPKPAADSDPFGLGAPAPAEKPAAPAPAEAPEPASPPVPAPKPAADDSDPFGLNAKPAAEEPAAEADEAAAEAEAPPEPAPAADANPFE